MQLKLSYLTNIGNKVNNPCTTQKSYWMIVNRLMNKCRVPKIPPLLINNQFILNCGEKAKYFSDFFSQQCKPIINNSILPSLSLFTDKRLDHVTIENDVIISLIRNITPIRLLVLMVYLVKCYSYAMTLLYYLLKLFLETYC